MSLSANFPTVAPSLTLDFANTKQLDPRITFTRATTATYYDGVTTAKAEENLLLYSQALATGPWGGLRSTRTNNAGTAPDGTNTATQLTQQAGQTTAGAVAQSLSVTANATTSVFAKADGKNFLIIQTQSSGILRTWFDLSTGAVGTTNANHTASIVNVGNGWYRCIVTSSQTGEGTTFYLADANNSITVTDSGSILLWGAQLEQRSAVSSYTVTTTQPITNYIPVLQTAASGVPRFDHNPITDVSLGLLIEEQRTNLWTYSGDFANAAWTKVRSSITSNTIVAPDGTLTGDKLIASTDANTTHFVRQDVSVTSGTAYTQTIYAKAGEYTQIYMAFDTDNSAFAGGSIIFTLTGNGIAGTPGGTLTSNSITPVGNGWYRCQITATATATATGIFRIQSATGNTNGFTGNGYSGIFIWGAQLEAGAFPTSYIATTTTTVQRNADLATMTGTNFSSWYNAAEGSVYVSGRYPFAAAIGVNSGLFDINDGTFNEAITVYVTPGQAVTYLIIDNGVSQGGPVIGNTTAVGSTIKAAVAYKVNDFAGSLNGAAVVTDTNGTIPTVNRLDIGAVAVYGQRINGTISKLSYYPLRLTNAQLQALTGS